MFDTMTLPEMIPIDISASGDNIIITGLPNQLLYIHQLLLVTAADVTVEIQKSNAPTVLSIIPLKGAGQGVVIENTRPDYPFLFAIEPERDLILNLSSAVAVKGHIIYSLRK